MDRRRTRHVVSRLLKQSILELCKASVPQEQGIEIDGIVCISIGDEDNEQIVVKVHERLGALRAIRHATSSQSLASPKARKSPELTVTNGGSTSEFQRKRQHLHSIASAASAKRMKLSVPKGEDEDGVGSTSSQVTTGKGSTTPTKMIVTTDLPLLASIKTEILSDNENVENSPTQQPNSVSIQNSNIEKYLGNASLDTVVFRDLECEHCRLLMPTFEELKAHNNQEHGASTCGYCWRSFLNLSNYQQHLKSHRKMRLGVKGRGSSKETSKKKKCGVCGENFRSVSLMMEHLKTSHHYEKCLTCITCDEYFPNRPSFIDHRKSSHADVQQCRCENCEVYFTYVEFKHHERECFGVETVNTEGSSSKRPIQQRPLAKVHIDEPDSGQQLLDATLDTTDSTTDLDPDTQVFLTKSLSNRELQLEAENVLGQILESEHSILEQTKALVTVKTKEPERITQVSLSGFLGDDANTDSASVDENTEGAATQKQSGQEEKSGDEEDEEEEEEQDGESDNASETSLGDGSYFLNSLNLMSVLEQSGKTGGNWDTTLPRPAIQQKSTPLACQGPYRCQTCFYVVENFEDFERHCFEMHSRFVCTYCAQTFANRRNLQRHIRRHVGDMPYVCDECGMRFYRDDNLRRHKLKHMTSVRFICSYCNTACESKNKLTSHLIGGHAIDVLKVTEQEIMKHVVLKEGSSQSSEVSVEQVEPNSLEVSLD